MNYKKELAEFREFKKNYKFTQVSIVNKDDKLYCMDTLIKDESGYYGESDKWINVGYSLKGMYPKLLSNLFPYAFKFKGYKLHSIESFFQAIKFPSIKMQKKLYKYSGKEALVLQKATDYEAFCCRVRSLLPNHQHLPDAKELQRMAVLSFAKPVAMWVERDAPVTGKRFHDYMEIALGMASKLAC